MIREGVAVSERRGKINDGVCVIVNSEGGGGRVVFDSTRGGRGGYIEVNHTCDVYAINADMIQMLYKYKRNVGSK